MEANLYKKTVLSNGITLVTEHMPYLRSVSLGIWVKAGPCDEDADVNGISHFIEHMVFKRTKKRTAYQIAAEIDQIGGQIDAYTSREYTSYSVRVLDEHLPRAFEILADMLLNSIFEQGDIDKERDVILEEIKMIDDTPSDYLYDIFCKSLWQCHPLGQPIQGTRDTVSAVTRDDILDYMENNYYPENIIITAAGNLDHDDMRCMAERFLGQLAREEKKKMRSMAAFNHTIKLKERSLEQIHFYLGVEGITSADADRYKAYLLNIIIGGGMSSRLFQKIREDKGLAYSIYSFNNMYEHGGLFGIYAATGKDNLMLTIDLILKEIKDIVKEPVPEDTLKKSKDQLKGGILLSLESSTSRMSQLARQECYFGRYISLDEIYKEIEKVSTADIHSFAGQLFSGREFSFAGLGAISGKDISSDMLIV